MHPCILLSWNVKPYTIEISVTIMWVKIEAIHEILLEVSQSPPNGVKVCFVWQNRL